jgi:hypothetical protein
MGSEILARDHLRGHLGTLERRAQDQHDRVETERLKVARAAPGA